MAKEDGRKKPGMTRWYDFSVMAMTSPRNKLSRKLGAMIDTRRFATSEGSDADNVLSYEDHAGDFWFDYIADTADGWNGTYTMAYLLSSDAVTPSGMAPMPRGQFLMQGGDEVYPFASKTQYAERFVWPFTQAAQALRKFRVPGELRDLYCIPGNHDWYDSLASFTRRFCNKRTIGCFRTRQGRSYFVLKLPHNWQLWAVDLQLHHDIDLHQLEFFRSHARTLSGSERIILCLAEPDWVYGQSAGEDLHDNVAYLERLAESSGAQVRVYIAGDLHHYQRYESKRTPENSAASKQAYSQTKLVAGGGGAFLHATHTYTSATTDGSELKAQYPKAGTSRLLSALLLLFAPLNWQLSLLFGLFYLALFWSIPINPQWTTVPLNYPGAFLLFLAVGICMVGFVDVRPRWPAPVRALVKLFWGMGHLAAHTALGWWTWRTADAVVYGVGFAEAGFLADYLVRAGVVPIGAAFGGTLLGLYLFLSVNLLGMHENDAFAALRISGYKHFLRCRLTPEALTIHVLGVPAVAGEHGKHPVPVQCVEEIALRP